MASSVGKVARLVSRLGELCLRNPSRIHHVLGIMLAACEEAADPGLDMLRFPRVQPEDLLPEAGLDGKAVIALFPRTHASLSLQEVLCLVLLLKRARADNVFEFGTYRGVSVTQLALNLQEKARVLTLDLPEQETDIRLEIPDPDERKIALETGKGDLIPPELRRRITLLRKDSAVFDESPYIGTMDFVFVDGAHSAGYVKNDSEKGWRMLRRGGIIAWHDCRIADPAVVRYLLKSPFGPTLISGTSLAFAIKG